jgi:amino acid adenylation domain-containing protein
MTPGTWTMGESFLRTARRVPERIALDLADATWTYATLLEKSSAIAATLQRACPHPAPQLTAIFSTQSATQFAGIVGALLAGTGFVPLDCRLPVERTRQILQLSLAQALIVDATAAPQLTELLCGFDRRLLILLPDASSASEIAENFPNHQIVIAPQMATPAEWHPVAVDPESLAYLMFTSGSTGRPKGVMVCHRNVEHFVRRITQRYALSETDRFTQLNSLGFDLSIMEVPIAWEVGAALCGPRKEHAINSVRYVNDLGITVWVSVPSKSAAAKQLGLLTPGAMPTLRLSAWCGEALPTDLTEAWSIAAPQSICDNHYGPTEATCSCMVYRYDSDHAPADSEHGVMPIGEPYPGMQIRVVDEHLQPVGLGKIGELLIVGPQVALGYWQDSARTAESFICDPESGAPAYRTGDLVRVPAEGKPMTFLGRRDFQLQVLGGRVELGEVEAALRAVTGAEIAIAMGWDERAATASYLVAFVSLASVDVPAVRTRLLQMLPAFAVPRRILAVPNLPLNPNGKVDRKALRAMMETA